MSKIKNDWRYIYVGEDSWMLEAASSDVENKLIDLIDGVPEAEEGPNVHLALEVISEKYRLLLTEYYFEGKTLEQMGNSRSKTKQYMHQELKKALIEIKSILNKQNCVP
jgi:DNA-directed RNA polymerase specialized sigma subunit